MTRDGWITTRIKSCLLFEKDLYSLNYTVETVNGVVYLTGVGQDEAEINRVAEVARNVGGVKKVVNHVKIKGQEEAPDSAEPVTPVENTSVETAPIDQSSTIPEAEDRE